MDGLAASKWSRKSSDDGNPYAGFSLHDLISIGQFCHPQPVHALFVESIASEEGRSGRRTGGNRKKIIDVKAGARQRDGGLHDVECAPEIAELKQMVADRDA